MLFKVKCIFSKQLFQNILAASCLIIIFLAELFNGLHPFLPCPHFLFLSVGVPNSVKPPPQNKSLLSWYLKRRNKPLHSSFRRLPVFFCASPYKLMVVVLIPLKSMCWAARSTVVPAPPNSTALVVSWHISVALPQQINLRYIFWKIVLCKISTVHELYVYPC